MTDPIADLLTRIRNASSVNKEVVKIPHSIIKESITNILKDEGYLENVSIENTDAPQKTISVKLKFKGKHPIISRIKRISKPGRRVYAKSQDIKPSLSGYGIKIISTSQGVMTNEAARSKNLGGEVLCEIW